MTIKDVSFGIYEVAIRVRDLDIAQAFYCDVLGIVEGLRIEERGMRFLRAPSDEGMVVLTREDDEFPSQHYAFGIQEADIEATQAGLRDAGVETADPVFHDGMPGTSIYFHDPDGHDLESFAPRV